MIIRKKTLIVLGGFGVSVFGLGFVYAQSFDEAEPILHEYVRIENVKNARGNSLLPGERGGAELPRGIVYNDEVLPQPSVAPNPGQEPDFVPDEDTFSPDEETEEEGVLSYEEIFNPAVAPFKRGRAFHQVLQDDSLGISSNTLQAIPVIGNLSDPTRTHFYGALDLSLLANQPHPIPTVSPEDRILSYETSPKVSLRFYKDVADNFYVESTTSTSVRLVFLVDTPKEYFAAPLPKGVTLSSVPSHLRPTLSTSQRERARTVLRAARISSTAKTFEEVLPKLVTYFRSFEAGTFSPRPDGDRYLALSLSQKGVCRHRSYAFVFTAHAMGIPARYVYNEAHAWVEVFIPETGWQRIDLGGASQGLEVSGARGKPLYEPEQEDPFAQPNTFEQSYSHPEAPNAVNESGFSRVTGVRQEKKEEIAINDPDAENTVATNEGNNGQVGDPSEETFTGDEEIVDEPFENWSNASPVVSGTKPVNFSLSPVPSQVFRGKALLVSGTSQGPEGPAAGIRVEVFLDRANDESEPVFLGATLSSEGGEFRGEFLIPADIFPLGEYRVVIATPGDQTFAPSYRLEELLPNVP